MYHERKIWEEDYKDIIWMFNNLKSYSVIAKTYGVSKQRIGVLINRLLSKKGINIVIKKRLKQRKYLTK